MSKIPSTYPIFAEAFVAWAREHSEIVGAGIVGSYARGQQTPASDVDAAIFCKQPSDFIADQPWLKFFGETIDLAVEQWGVVQTVRAFFKSGLEVEFNFSSIFWADVPVDPGTFRVVSDGFEIMYDPTGKLAKLKQEVGGNSELGA